MLLPKTSQTKNAWIQEVDKQDKVVKIKKIFNYNRKGYLLSILERNENGEERVV